MVEAVVNTLSSGPAVNSVIEGASEATVATDCTESREAFDARAVLVLPDFLVVDWDWLTKTKNAQSGDRL
jgi:hypothetical protein